MIYAFKRRRGCQGCAVVLAIAILIYVITFSWFMIPAQIWPLKLLFILPALALSIFMPGIVLDVFSRGPVLVISPEGLLYLPFSKQPVPWSDVTDVTLTLGYWVNRGTRERSRAPFSDFVSYAVGDPSCYPKPPGALRLDGRPIPILPTSVQASRREIVTAIEHYWKGKVREVEGAPPPPDQQT